MAGKSTKNPLLSGAGISFPFENFPTNTLLVPVPQTEPSLIPEEIEADSFLGQEPHRGGSLSKSVSSQSLGSTVPKPALKAETRSHLPAEPHLSAASSSPVPEFTKSFTGGLFTAKPTPVYADALSHNLLRSTQASKTISPPTAASPLLFPNPPSILTPLPVAVLPSSSPVQKTCNKSPSSFPPPVVSSPATNSSVQPGSSSNKIFSNISTSEIFTPALVPVPIGSTDSDSQYTNQSLSFTSSSNVPPTSTPVTSNLSTNSPYSSNWFSSNPSILEKSVPASNGSFNSNQVFNHFSTPAVIQTSSSTNSPSEFVQHPANFFHPNTSTPSILNPSPVPSVSPIQHTQSSSSDIPSAPPQQSIFSYFSLTQQTTSSLPKPTLSSPLTCEAPSTPAVLAPSNFPPQSLQTVAPPVSGKSSNSYRLSNVKRPTYTRPPELGVTPMAAMPTPVATAPQPATLFTPDPAPVATAPQSATLFSPNPTPLAPAPQPATLFTPDPTPVSAPRDSVDSVPPATITTLTHNPPVQASVLPPSFANLAQGNTYRPVYHHWFYKKLVEGKVLWSPFTMQDSLNLEEAFTSATISPDTKVAADGGRYDVEVLRRRRTAVYWQEEPSEVRRCSWFVKGSMDVRYIPFEENVATMLEEEYKIASTGNSWNRQVQLPDGELIIIHSAHAISHHTRSTSPDVWGNTPQMQQKPRVVKRGMDEFDINDGEPEKVDHLLFLVHGIGKFCDMKFRPVIEVVDDFRSASLQLLQSHFKEAVESGQVGRVEVLPISWHDALHSAHIDQRLDRITLSSIPRLRHFTNDTLLDILFYTSPVFCETIVQAVGGEMNRLYDLFLTRNPSFQGGVSLGGHSLGSLILFDMLSNQKSDPETKPASPPTTPTGADEQSAEAGEGGEEVKSLGCMKAQKAKLSRSVSYVTIGTAGTGQPFISYPQLNFKPRAFFALGSPIGMFVTVRGIESLGEDFVLPTCPQFYNIFHPFDPVAYRVESLINADFAKYSPLLIPHHKGRKRMHLELKDTLEHVGTALKQKLLESVRSTWNTVYQTMFTRAEDSAAIEQEMNKVIEKEIMQSHASCADDAAINSPGPEVKMGQLNGGRRVDYVLQEAPLESFNEYLFALSSHVCYWESEDTMLMMLKEIYATMGVSPDSQVMQQILPFEPPEGLSGQPQYVSLPSAPGEGVGMDPTAPPSDHANIGPPPIAGFFRQ